MASNSSSNSGFSSTSVMFGLGAVVSTAERSTFPVLLSSWSNWFANLSKDSTLCCTPSSSVAHILLSSHFKRLSCRFYLPPAGILQPPHHWDFIFLVYCCRFRRAPVISALFGLSNVQLKLFHPCIISFIQKDPSPSFYCLRNNPGGSDWVYLKHSERCHM